MSWPCLTVEQRPRIEVQSRLIQNMSVLPLNIHLRELGLVNFLRNHNKKDTLLLLLFKDNFSCQNFKDFSFDKVLRKDTGPYA